MIIDGNHYPQDIRATAAGPPDAVRAGFVAAFSVSAEELPPPRAAPAPARGAAGDRRRAGAGAGKAEPGPVVEAIRAGCPVATPLPIADVRLVAAGAIPRTTSGKLARRACRAEYLAGSWPPPPHRLNHRARPPDNVPAVSEYQTLTFEQDGPIARIVLNRPDAANGMNDVMTAELAQVARRCDTAAIKVVVLTGAGRFFCAGETSKAMAASPLGPGPSSRASPTTCTGPSRRSPGWMRC